MAVKLELKGYLYMRASLRITKQIGKITVTKGTQGIVKGVSNSDDIAKTYQYFEGKKDNFFYLVKFPEIEYLFNKSDLEFF